MRSHCGCRFNEAIVDEDLIEFNERPLWMWI